jgi:cyclophilin family peptidyl-prolyl cis-trans isomerase
MAQHKAATDVTIAPLGERSLFEQAVRRYWMPVAAALVLGTLFVLYREHGREKGKSEQSATWAELFASLGEPDELETLADRLDGDPAADWARLQAVVALVGDRRLDEAARALEELRGTARNHPLGQDLYDFGDGRPPRSLLDHLAESIESQRAFEKAHPDLFANPPLPQDAPKVRLQTEKGDIVVGLYAEAAPSHVENFLTHCRSGFYDGTRFHKVVPGILIQGGDPNSKSEDRTTWGQGGSEPKLAPEPNDLHHFAGALSAAKLPGETHSSGSQFILTTDPAHHMDGEHVVFGAVVEGMDVVRTIASGVLSEGSGDQPETPVVLMGTTVL